MSKTIDFFNLSFLDLLSGALGAVIFLFIIVPKGEGEGPAAQLQLYVSYDTVQAKFFGEIPDSLLQADIGDTLLAMVFDFKKAPKAQQVRRVPPKRATPPPKPKKRKESVKPAPVAVSKTESPRSQKTSSPSTPAQSSNTTLVPEFQGSKPDVPCVFSIEVKWQSPKDNVDLRVCKENACVFGGKRKNPAIGFWDSGKSKTSLFGGDLRTNQEAVRQFDKIIPGEYQIFAQFKDAKVPKDEVNLRLTVYTRNEEGIEQGETHQIPLKFDPNELTHVGVAQIGENGSVSYKNL